MTDEKKYLPYHFDEEDIKKMNDWGFYDFSKQCWSQYDTLIKIEAESQGSPERHEIRMRIKKLNKVFKILQAETERRYQESGKVIELERQKYQPQQKRAKK